VNVSTFIEAISVKHWKHTI